MNVPSLSLSTNRFENWGRKGKIAKVKQERVALSKKRRSGSWVTCKGHCNSVRNDQWRGITCSCPLTVPKMQPAVMCKIMAKGKGALSVLFPQNYFDMIYYRLSCKIKVWSIFVLWTLNVFPQLSLKWCVDNSYQIITELKHTVLTDMLLGCIFATLLGVRRPNARRRPDDKSAPIARSGESDSRWRCRSPQARRWKRLKKEQNQLATNTRLLPRLREWFPMLIVHAGCPCEPHWKKPI